MVRDRRVRGDVFVRVLRDRNSGLARLSHQIVHRHAWDCWRSGVIEGRHIARPSAEVIRLPSGREAV